MVPTIERTTLAGVGMVPSQPTHTPREALAAALAFVEGRKGAPDAAALARMILALPPGPEPIERVAWVARLLDDPSVAGAAVWQAELGIVHPLEELARQPPERIMVSRVCSIETRELLLLAAAYVFVLDALRRTQADMERRFAREHAWYPAQNARSSSAPPLA